jgi:hypothetical protein
VALYPVLLRRSRGSIRHLYLFVDGVAMASKPTQRSLAYLRKNGWTVCIVEKWVPPRGSMKFGVRIDAYGFGDLLACNPCPHGGFHKPAIALIQTTDATSFSKHKLKILGIPEFQKWKDAGGIVLLHGWRKGPKDGVRGARKVWVLREEIL